MFNSEWVHEIENWDEIVRRYRMPLDIIALIGKSLEYTRPDPYPKPLF